MIRSDIYRATIEMIIERMYAPNDKANYSTEFVFDLTSVHPKDDIGVHALMSSYDWVKFIQREVKSYSNEVKPICFTLEVIKNGKLESLFEWNSDQKFTIEEAVQFAIASPSQTEKPEIQEDFKTLQIV